jgi:hypothetical protein
VQKIIVEHELLPLFAILFFFLSPFSSGETGSAITVILCTLGLLFAANRHGLSSFSVVGTVVVPAFATVSVMMTVGRSSSSSSFRLAGTMKRAIAGVAPCNRVSNRFVVVFTAAAAAALGVGFSKQSFPVKNAALFARPLTRVVLYARVP